MPSVQCPQPCPELRPGSCSDCRALPRPHVHGRFLGACPLLAEVYRGDGALIRPVKCLPLEGRQAGRVPEDSGNCCFTASSCPLASEKRGVVGHSSPLDVSLHLLKRVPFVGE